MKNTILILGCAIALSFIPQAFGNEQALRGSYSICYDQDGRPCNGFHKQKMPDGGTYEIMYKNGKANGKGELTRPDGSKIKTQFINGQATGKATELYPSGKLAAEYHFTNGIADGESKSYYESGQLKSLKNYKMGQESGIWRQYHENGKITANAFPPKKHIMKTANSKAKKIVKTENTPAF